MSVHNADVARIFNHLADLLEIEAANPFRVCPGSRAELYRHLDAVRV